ncbi:hypothetical protein [Pseudoxanthomonas sp. CF125]|uniref:hypothetical protein n=1 Tax=Pseudoxanthomonas sp. CF125 TaxID=1855303 RepID=UPI00115FC463|nr:hypothetical protein [Pseudoxanthomonas sp. CF125]
MTDEAMSKLSDAMREKFGAGVEFELALGELVGRYRRAHDAAMRDQQAAELLPLGRNVAAIRLGVAPSTVYKMCHRHRRNRSTPDEAA